MLYLVKCNVEKSYYMGDTKTEEQTHIVEANSEQEAMLKVENYYKKQDSSYSVSHWVNFEYINELIS